MAASPNIVSRGDSLILTQSEATAAQRTWLFYLSNSADGTAATGKTIATSDFQISKAGGAFADATGTVTEISLGWYKMVFLAGDLDTIGALACHITEAGVDTLLVVHQITALDLNTATVALTAASITTATFAAGAIDAAAIGVGAIAADAFAAGAIDAAAIAANAIGTSEFAAATIAAIADAVWDEAQSGHVTAGSTGLLIGLIDDVDTAVDNLGDGEGLKNRYHSMGTRTTDGNFSAFGCEDAADGVITVTGTWNGATATAQTCTNPLATVPAWVAYGTPLTADGVIALTGPIKAVRVALTDDGASTSLTASLALRVYRAG